jgi:hypothetical protein
MLLSAVVPSLSIVAPMLSTTPTELQRSLEFQRSPEFYTIAKVS